MTTARATRSHGSLNQPRRPAADCHIRTMNIMALPTARRARAMNHRRWRRRHRNDQQDRLCLSMTIHRNSPWIRMKADVSARSSTTVLATEWPGRLRATRPLGSESAHHELALARGRIHLHRAPVMAMP